MFALSASSLLSAYVFSERIKDDHKTAWDDALLKRTELIEALADVDDVIANHIIERESLENVSPKEINEALRRVTLARVRLHFMFSFFKWGFQYLN